MNELAIANQDVQVVAETPEEMKESNNILIRWCDNKISQLRAEHRELDAAYKSAVEKKWKSSTLKHHANIAAKRVVFFQKIKRALEHGFYIVPNFPVTLFAIRTDRAKPLKLVSTRSWSDHEQGAMTLPEGEGQYQNPFPENWQRDVTSAEDRAKNKTVIQYFAKKWRALDFPITMAKPRIMEAVNRTMALKLFDDFGVLPSPYRKSDPIIVARIKNPLSTQYNLRTVSFVIAWSLDTKSL